MNVNVEKGGGGWKILLERIIYFQHGLSWKINCFQVPKTDYLFPPARTYLKRKETTQNCQVVGAGQDF